MGDLIEIRRETTRSTVALLIIALLSVLAALIVIYTLTHDGDPKEIISGVFARVIGIVGTLLGFYFGSQNTRQGALAAMATRDRQSINPS